MSLLHRHTAALAEIEWTNECLVCGAYTVPHTQGHHYVLDHTDDCAWAEARNTIGERRTQTKYER